MKTVRELIKEAESKLDDEHKDVNVAKVLFYHLAKKEPHELYLMMNEEVEPELEKAFLVYSLNATKRVAVIGLSKKRFTSNFTISS